MTAPQWQPYSASGGEREGAAREDEAGVGEIPYTLTGAREGAQSTRGAGCEGGAPLDPSASRPCARADSSDTSRATRLLAAADRVREAGEAHRAAAAVSDAAWAAHRAQAHRTKQSLHDARPGCEGYCPLFAAYSRAAVPAREAYEALLVAQRALTALALEPGDSAWALGVLGAAAKVQASDAALEDAETAWRESVGVEAWVDMRGAGDAVEAAERTLLAAARGAR